MAKSPQDKHAHILELLERGSVYIHLDPRRPGVSVPQWLRDRHQLVLQIGLNFPIPIRDLEIDDEGVRCTLSFNRQPTFCELPWTAVYALVGDDGQVTVFPGELPSEMSGEQDSKELGAPQAVRTRKPPKDKTATPRKKPSPALELAPTPLVLDESPAMQAAVASEKPSLHSEPSSASDDAPKRLTRSGREVPAWLRVVK
ncbi:MAG: ClpXP protease specificity-enhancing factor SspB [Deltaproteobacteria bacterium]|nr:ClpXP protease specificity-enhancing factor SspB [Deltaproteobacteria bacterium]